MTTTTRTPGPERSALVGLATAAARLWGVTSDGVEWLIEEFNAFCRVTLPDGAPAALRLVAPHLTDAARLDIEVAWLDHMAADDPEIGAARCRRTLDGRAFVHVRTAAVPEGRWCSVLSWVPGRRLGADAPVERYGALGRLTARLHRSAERFDPVPPGIPAWRSTWENGTPDALFGPLADGLINPRQRTLIAAAGERCDALISDLIAEWGTLVVHADLHPWNVFTDGSRLYPLDFSDIMVSAPPLDFAAPLGCLLDRPEYPTIRDAFLEGYAAIRPGCMVDDATLQGMQHAYWLAVIDVLVREQRTQYYHRIDETCRRLETWLDA